MASGGAVKPCQTLASRPTPCLTIGAHAKPSLQDFPVAASSLPDLAQYGTLPDALDSIGTDGRSWRSASRSGTVPTGDLTQPLTMQVISLLTVADLRPSGRELPLGVEHLGRYSTASGSKRTEP